MYAVETAKMSSKGQVVIPDALRKSHGWTAGMTLLMIGTADAVLIQPLQLPSEASIGKTLAEAKTARADVALRMKKARAALTKLHRLNIALPDDAEKSAARRASLQEKYA